MLVIVRLASGLLFGRHMSLVRLFIILFLSLNVALAQTEASQTEDSQTEASQTQEMQTEETETAEPDYAVVVDVGLGAGWPGYQLYQFNVALQKDVFGIAFRGSWTEAGPYISAAGRYYTPIPVPVPTFVSVGAGVLVDSPIYFASLGAQLPVYGPDLRLTLEAGASYQTVFQRGQVLPYLSAGLSYSFIIDAAPISKEERARRELERSRPANCEPTDPDRSKLRSSLSRGVKREVRQAKASYAGVYKNVNYSYSVKDIEYDGDKAQVTASYSASATQVVNGKRISGSGTIIIKMSWNGCGWSVGGYSFEE